MEFFLKKPPRGKTKVFTLNHNGKSLDLKINSTTRKTGIKAGTEEIQASELIFQGQKYDKWRKEDSLLKLINDCIGFKYNGDRNELLEYLYRNEKGEL